MSYLKALMAFIELHPTLAYAAISLVALSESLAVIGLVIPGTVIMFGIGTLVATGSLALKPVPLLAAVGAIAGDGISYWLGHHYQEKLKGVWPFSSYPGILKNGETFFLRHGGKSVLFGRFVGPVRPVIPVVVGILGMHPLKFAIVNVCSAIGWAFVYILPGVFFGTSLALAGTVSSRLAVLLFVIIVSLWGFIWLGRKVTAFVVKLGPAFFAALKHWAQIETPVPGRTRQAKDLFAYLFLRRQGEELFLAFLVILLLGTLWGFLGVLQDVLAKDPLVAADEAIYNLFQSLRTSWTDHFMVIVTELGDYFVLICLSVSLSALLLFKRCIRTAIFFITAALGGFLGVQLLKELIHVPRPITLYHGASAYGFPSGHTTMSVIFFGFLAIILSPGLSHKRRWGLFTTVLFISFAMATSRLYLGAHWLSDVLGGFLIGSSWTALLGISSLKGPTEPIPRRLLMGAVLFVLLFAGGWNVSRHLQKDLAIYAPQHPVRSLSRRQWLAAGWRELPSWRIDLAGEREQPLTIQGEGSPQALAEALSHEGWQIPPSLTLKSFLGMFSPDTPIEKLPVLPRLHDGLMESLQFFYHENGQRWVLRLWPTFFRIADGKPLFVGTVEAQERRSLTGLITAALDTGEYDRALEKLNRVILDAFTLERVRRPSDEIRSDRGKHSVGWTGIVFLLWKNTEPPQE